MMSQATTKRVPMTGRAAALKMQAMAAEYVEAMGRRIRARRDELGLTRDAVAREMGGSWNGNSVYRWENGKHEPGAAAKTELARVLQVDVTYFYADAPIQEVPDLMAAMTVPGDLLDRVEAKLDLTMRALTLTLSTERSDEAVDDVLREMDEFLHEENDRDD